MSNTAASEAGRQLVMIRWGNQKPRRLARELAKRAGELDKTSRDLVREALDTVELAGGDAA